MFTNCPVRNYCSCTLFSQDMIVEPMVLHELTLVFRKINIVINFETKYLMKNRISANTF